MSSQFVSNWNFGPNIFLDIQSKILNITFKHKKHQVTASIIR